MKKITNVIFFDIINLGDNMFGKRNIDYILKRNKKRRLKELSDNLDNIVFLDYDGVINLDFDNFDGKFKDIDLFNNLSKFCLDNNFKIVVISSWRKYSNYKSMLYDSGLDKRVEIVGATGVLEKDRESEVLKYIEEHCYINKFIILDDRPFNLLKKYQVQTDSNLGFNAEKYNEALDLIKQDLWY